MPDEIVPTEPVGYAQFRDRLTRAMHVTARGVETWTARTLQEVLGYDRWENFEKVVEKAKVSCAKSEKPVDNHFRAFTKMVGLGSGATRPINDHLVTRYAAYLIAMEAAPEKQEVAFAKTYFAIQTRRQEITDAQAEDDKRIETRRRVSDGHNKLAKTAYRAGVRRFGIFHDAGQRAMYGGLSAADVKALKQIPEKEELYDRIGRAELAMHEFRITQTEQKIVNEGIVGEEPAIRTHAEVGRIVRQTAEQISGTMPEKLPAAPSIKKIEAARRKALKAKPKKDQPAN